MKSYVFTELSCSYPNDRIDPVKCCVAAALGIKPNSSGFKGPSDLRPAATIGPAEGIQTPVIPLERRES